MKRTKKRYDYMSMTISTMPEIKNGMCVNAKSDIEKPVEIRPFIKRER